MILQVAPQDLLSVVKAPLRTALYFVQHHTYSPRGRKMVDGVLQPDMDTLYGTQIDSWHRLPVKWEMQHGKLVNVGGRGWKSGLGYHILINPNGVVEVGDRWIKQLPGAHCKEAGLNFTSIGVCLVGNFDIDEPTSKQQQAWVEVTRVLAEAYKIPLETERMVLHRHFAYAPFPPKEGQKPYKTCPGKKMVVQTYLDWLKEE